MPKCTECSKELKKEVYVKSSPRPHNAKESFIKCSCGNIMIGTFGTLGHLKTVKPTPKTKSKDTDIMIEEAKELFFLVGCKVGETEYSRKDEEVEEVEDEPEEDELEEDELEEDEDEEDEDEEDEDEDMGHAENSIKDEELTKDVPKSELKLTRDEPKSANDESSTAIDPCSVCPLFLGNKEPKYESKCGKASIRVRGLKRLLYILGEEE